MLPLLLFFLLNQPILHSSQGRPGNLGSTKENIQVLMHSFDPPNTVKALYAQQNSERVLYVIIHSAKRCLHMHSVPNVVSQFTESSITESRWKQKCLGLQTVCLGIISPTSEKQFVTQWLTLCTLMVDLLTYLHKYLNAS